MSNNAKKKPWNTQKTPTKHVLRLFNNFLKIWFSAQKSGSRLRCRTMLKKIHWNTQKTPTKHVLRLFEKFLKIRFSAQKCGSQHRFWTMLKYLETLSPASIDSSPASTDLSPASTDSSLLAFLLLEPSPTPTPHPPPPYNQKNISSKKMYFLNLISSFFISLIWNNTFKKYSAIPRMHIFLKNTVNTNPKLFRVNSMPQAVDCLQMSRIRCVLKCIHRRGWSHSTETHFTPMKSTGSCLFTWETSHLKFAHERCVSLFKIGSSAWHLQHFAGSCHRLWFRG